MPAVARIHRALLPLFSSLFVPLGFLTASSAVALHRAWGQPWMVAFVVSAYVNLLLLFGCVGMYENAPPDDLRKRAQLKIAISCLATTLNASFCHQVTKLMPPAVSVLLWCLVVKVAAAGIWVFFFANDSRGDPRPVVHARNHVDGNAQ